MGVSMTLQRRHFELIADTIAGADIPQVEKNRVIRQFSVVLAQTNPNFNRVKFEIRAGIEEVL